MADKNQQIAAIKHDFDKLAATSGTISKRRLINSFKGTITNRALRLYLDPAVKFKLRTNESDGDTPEFGTLFALCKYLQENEGKDAERLFLESVNTNLRGFVRDFLRNNLSLGITMEDFNACNEDKPIQRVSKKSTSQAKPKFAKKHDDTLSNMMREPMENFLSQPFNFDQDIPVDEVTYTMTIPGEECHEQEQL